MKRSLNNLIGYKILAYDRLKGTLKDFLFDEESWMVRYIEADYGGILSDKKVLIPKEFLKTPVWDKKQFPISLSSRSIESCPGIDKISPVSREYEKELNKHYNLDQYWPYVYPTNLSTVIFPPRPIRIPIKSVEEDEVDTSLRSFKEISGYRINAIDGKIGHIEDMVIDDEDWHLIYIVVDISNWMPWSKKVMLPIDWLEEISYVKREISIKLLTEIIKEAPEFDGRHPIELDFEKGLHDFYNKAFTHQQAFYKSVNRIKQAVDYYGPSCFDTCRSLIPLSLKTMVGRMEVIFALIKKTKVNLNIISQNKIDKLIDLPDK